LEVGGRGSIRSFIPQERAAHLSVCETLMRLDG
jgi:hypothetical protein